MGPTKNDTDADESTDTESEWPIKEPRKVLSQRKLRYPPVVQDAIAGDHPEGLSVYWNYDPQSDFVFISESPARKEPYQYAARNSIEDPDGEYTKIRARDELPDRILTKFELEGSYMVYLASQQMLTGDNPSAWILTWSQFTRMLPGGVDPDDPDDDSVNNMITNNPGFLPSQL